MKNRILFLFMLALLLGNCTPKVTEKAKTTTDEISKVMVGKEDFRKQVPKAGPPPKIQIGTAEEFQLDNGLKVIVVENHRLPRVSYQLFIDAPEIMQNDKTGFIDMTYDLINKGTTNRTKAEIDEAIDFMGAQISTATRDGRGIYASSLTKHNETLLDIMSDILLNPTFPDAEFDKLKKQTLSALAQSKEDADAIASNVSSVMRYGKNHPYGEITTEASIANLSSGDCKAYYEAFFKPNISYLVVVGDITAAQVKPMLEKRLGAWKASQNIPKTSFDLPAMPTARTLDFVNKPGAVQSVINITYPIELKPGHPDVIKSRVMNTLLGGFFQSRLNQNLRETHAYTYGARSRLANDKMVGSFSATASVRNEVTDSSLIQFMHELNSIRNEMISQADLDMVKNVLAGRFGRSLEQPETVARFALNTARYNLPADYYVTYLEKLSTVNLADVQAMAKKYIQPDKAHVIVVGNQDEVVETLGSFATSGKVDFYDHFGNPVANDKIPDGVTAQTVIEDYLNAIGGADKLKTVTKLHQSMGLSMGGMSLGMESYQQEPNKYTVSTKMNGTVMEKQTYDGTRAKVTSMQGNKELEGKDLEEQKERVTIFPELTYDAKGYKTELKSIEEVNGKKAYKILVESPSGIKTTDYYDMESSLKVRNINAKGEAVGIGDYKAVNGILFPHTLSITLPNSPQLDMKVKTIEVNGTIDASVFTIE